jgi:hypothetical protein
MSRCRFFIQLELLVSCGKKNNMHELACQWWLGF